tara:strand:- start:1991 stop:2188 length:198 start_codon:yes stop_codon:yes gene_type:complete
MNKFLEKFLLGKMLKSKKFWYTIVGIITTFLSDNFGLNPEEVNNILMSIAALVLGQGIADTKVKK